MKKRVEFDQLKDSLLWVKTECNKDREKTGKRDEMEEREGIEEGYKSDKQGAGKNKKFPHIKFSSSSLALDIVFHPIPALPPLPLC